MAVADYDFALTRNEIIEMAHRKVGALSLGQGLSAEQIDSGVKQLDGMVKSWQNEHVFLWTQRIETVDLVGSDPDYALSTDPRR